MSFGSMWAPANISQTMSTPPPRTPRRNGAPNYKETDYTSPSNGTPAAKDGMRSGVSRGGWKRPKELLAEPSGGAASLLSRIDFGGSPPPMSSPPVKDGSTLVARQPASHVGIDVTQTKADKSSSRPDRPPASTSKQSSLPAAPVRVSKWAGSGVAGSAASKWAVKHPVQQQDKVQEAGPSSKEEEEGKQDVATLEHYIEKLDMGEPQEVILPPKTESVDEAPNSAQTSNFDTMTTGTSEPSIAGPSTPPSRQSDLHDSSAKPTAIPSTPSKYDWADEDDEDLDVEDLAAEWGIAVPGHSKGVWKVDEVVKTPANDPSPAATERTPNKAAPVSSRSPPLEADSIKVKSFASDRIPRLPPTKPSPIELLPASPSLPVSSHIPPKGHVLSPPSAAPAPTIRSPRKDRPRPEVRSDAFARLSKGLLKNQGK